MSVFHWSITYLSLLFVAMALDVIINKRRQLLASSP
jgi:heme O synthase-like polyprenyltransferase